MHASSAMATMKATMRMKTAEAMEVVMEVMEADEAGLAAEVCTGPCAVSPCMFAVGSFADRRTGRKIRKQDRRHKDRKPAHGIDMVRP